jgi:hypothetical protein
MRAYGFVDWSGDPGFKFAIGSSSRFALAVVSTDHYDELRRALQELKHQLGVPRGYEFHFAHNPHRVRRAFFASLSALEWDAAVLSVDKRVLSADFARMQAPAFSSVFLKHLFAYAPLSITQVKYLLVDDQHKEGRLVVAIRSATSETLRAREIARVPIVCGEPAHQWDGLQVADMLAGAVVEFDDEGRDYLKGLTNHLQVYWYKTVK